MPAPKLQIVTVEQDDGGAFDVVIQNMPQAEKGLMDMLAEVGADYYVSYADDIPTYMKEA